MNEQAINFLRFLSATAYALLQEQAAQGLFQRPWGRLIPEERLAVVNQTNAHLGNPLTLLTPETVGRVMQQAVATQERQTGFQAPSVVPPAPPVAATPQPTSPSPPPSIPGQTGGPQ